MSVTRKTGATPAPRRAAAPAAGPRRPRRRSGRGALSIIVGLFVMAGILRLGAGVGAAVERKTAQPEPAVHAAAPTPAACDKTAGLAMPLVAALKAREDRVAALETALADRRQALAVTEKAVDAKLMALRAAEEKLSKTIAIADSAADKDVARLTEVYAAMKPKQAAAVFEKMAPEFAAGFLGRMPPTSAAAILSGLSPEKAYTVSVILAGRNAAAPTD